MEQGTHQLVVWTRMIGKSKEFLITARKPDARLSDVTNWAKENGYEQLPPLLVNVTKVVAECERAKVKAEYIRNGFTYRSFPQM
jgi:hypothetical protein